MDAALGIVAGQPWWIYPLLALLVWRGLRAAKPRIGDWRVVMAVPGIFIAWGVAVLAMKNWTQTAALAWFAGAVLGAALSAPTARLDGMRVDHAARLVHMPGSWLPLLRYMLIFTAKDVLGVLTALRPDLAAQLALWDMGVSGAGTGYFVAWLSLYLIRCRRAPHTALT